MELNLSQRHKYRHSKTVDFDKEAINAYWNKRQTIKNCAGLTGGLHLEACK